MQNHGKHNKHALVVQGLIDYLESNFLLKLDIHQMRLCAIRSAPMSEQLQPRNDITMKIAPMKGEYGGVKKILQGL